MDFVALKPLSALLRITAIVAISDNQKLNRPDVLRHPDVPSRQIISGQGARVKRMIGDDGWSAILSNWRLDRVFGLSSCFESRRLDILEKPWSMC